MSPFELLNDRLKETMDRYDLLLEERWQVAQRSIIHREALSDLIFKGRRLDDIAVIRPVSELNVEIEFLNKVKPVEFERFLMDYSGGNLEVSFKERSVALLALTRPDTFEEIVGRFKRLSEALTLSFKKEREKLLSNAKESLSFEGYREFHSAVDEAGSRWNVNVKETPKKRLKV